MSCAHCTDAGQVFGKPLARFERLTYRWFGPSRSTAFLLDAIRRRAGESFTLLDVGGGIGAVQHGLADRMTKGTGVDASPAYVELARRQAEERGYLDRMHFLSGDFMDVAHEVDPHDAVTLDRVICCYPDMQTLVTATADRARRVYGLVFPRERLLNRVAFAGTNVWMRLRRSAFRTYIHDTDAVDRAAASSGLRLAESRTTTLWQIRIYERTEDGV